MASVPSVRAGVLFLGVFALGVAALAIAAPADPEDVPPAPRVVEVRVVELPGEGWLGTWAFAGQALRAFRETECTALLELIAASLAVALETGPPAAIDPPAAP